MKRRVILFGAPFIIGVCVGVLAPYLFSSANPGEMALFEQHEIDSPYSFVSPLLECQDVQGVPNKFATTLRDKLENLIEDWKSSGKINDTSVYFRDLNNGPWVGINEKEEFSPASLLKIPIMMSLYKEEEQHPGFLESKIEYEADVTTVQPSILPSKAITQGDIYTVGDLTERMIKYSDNNAMFLLSEFLGGTKIGKTYNELGIPAPEPWAEYTLKVKAYASFFRILYNATYLSKENSEKSLALLAQSDYKNGLVAGVAADIPIAHKFGERTFTGNSVRQLHDCGIIYYPHYPYLLCVMTKANNQKNAENFIRNVSALVYDEMKAEMK